MDPDVLQPEVAPNVNVPPPSMPDVSDVPGAAPVGPPPNVLAGSVQSNVQPPQSGLRHFITQATGSLLSGTVPHYYHDETGNLQVEHVKEQPGQLFRRILASSILGGAVGAESGPSGIKGALRGAQAVGDKSEAMDAQARQRADQDFLARQKVAQEQRENAASQRAQEGLNLQKDQFAEQKVMNQASLAHQTVSELHQAQEFALRSQEYLEARQERQNQQQVWLHDNGGQLAALPDNGKEGNGSTLMKHLQDNPTDMKPPAGFVYQPFSSVNLEGLHKDKDDVWKDKENKPVDLSARTTWKVYQVPEKILDQPITVTPDQAKKVGVILPANSKGYTVPFSRWVDMNTKHDELAARNAHEVRMSSEANLRSLHLANNEQLLALRAKKDEIKASELPTNEKNKQLASLGAQIDQVSEDNVGVLNKLRASAGVAPVTPKAAAASPLDAAANALKNVPEAQRESLIANNTLLSDDDKTALRQRLGMNSNPLAGAKNTTEYDTAQDTQNTTQARSAAAVAIASKYDHAISAAVNSGDLRKAADLRERKANEIDAAKSGHGMGAIGHLPGNFNN